MPQDLGPPARLPFPVTRALSAPVETRDDTNGGMPTMVGHFSTFNDFYEVDSLFEGHFLERISPRAFDKTISESRDQMKVLYDHGQDPQIGNKVLGSIEDLRTDRKGPAFTVPLFDTSYNRDLAPGLKAGAYGSSFRFTVEKDVWDNSPEASTDNPTGIPERTITEARVFEFGPVTFPANPNATAGVRSTTDTFYKRSRDPESFETLLRTAQVARTPSSGAAASSRQPSTGTPPEPPHDTDRLIALRGDSRSLSDLAAHLLADEGALAAAIDKLANGEMLLPREAELLSAAIEHLGPMPEGDMNSLPSSGAERRKPDPPPETAPSKTQDPPEGGSSDSRSSTVEYITRDDMASRVTELEESIKTRAVAYPPGRLPAEEKAKDKADKEERETLLAGIAEWDERQAYVATIGQRDQNVDDPQRSQPIKPYSPPVPTIQRQVDPFDFGEVEARGRSFEHRNQLYRDNAMRIIENATFPHPDTDVQRTRDRMAWLLDHHDSPDKELARRFMATASPLYRRAFNKLVMHQPLSPEEQRGTALAVGVDATGGFAIPVIFDLSVIAIGIHTGAINPYRRVCRIVPIVGTDTWNALTATAVTATRTTEAAPAIEQGPTFAQPQQIVKRVQAQITYSLEVAQDRADISSEMAKLIQEAKDNEEETSWATGIGTVSASLGVGPVIGTAGAYTGLLTAVAATLAAADLDATEAALPVRHRFNAQWFLSRAAIRKIQSLETTGGKLFGAYGAGYPAVGNPNAEATGNTGLRILGYQVNESPSLPTATAPNTTIGTLLNPDSYVIVDRIGMSVQLIPFIFGAGQGNLVTGQQALYAMWRNDARPLNVDAGRTLRFT